MALIEDLSQNYNQYARPVEHEDQPLDIKFGISLQQIINLVGKKGMKDSPAWGPAWLGYCDISQAAHCPNTQLY